MELEMPKEFTPVSEDELNYDGGSSDKMSTKDIIGVCVLSVLFVCTTAICIRGAIRKYNAGVYDSDLGQSVNATCNQNLTKKVPEKPITMKEYCQAMDQCLGYYIP